MRSSTGVARLVVAVMCLTALVVGCNNQIDDPDQHVSLLIWDTQGGGDSRFEITRDGDGFQVRITRYAFATADQVVSLSSEDGDVYSLVTEIFEQRRDLHDDTFTPTGMTGTWTTIILVYSEGTRDEIDNIRAWDELSIITGFVDQHMESQ